MKFGRTLLACASVLVAVVVVLLAMPPAVARPVTSQNGAPHVPSVAETDEPCAQCHAGIYARYLKTSMANASGNAASAIIPGSFTHAPSGVTYTVGVEDGRAYMAYDRAASSKGAALHGRTPLDLFVGSNHRGRTFLFHVEDWWFETPINYYSAGRNGYDMAPNYLSARHMPMNLPVTPDCLHCHASAVQITDAGSRNRYLPAKAGETALPFQQGGITCEDCHGDATEHMRSGGAIINPAHLPPQRRDAVCYRCHLEGETNVQNPARNPAQFKPGDRLEDYVTYFIRQNDLVATTARAVSQVEALNLSKCKRASGDRMSCTSCHDPHGEPGPEERVQFFRAKCLQCHSQQKFASITVPHAHHPEQADCTACHMPRVSAEDIAHSQSTDHRIILRRGEYESASSARQARSASLGGGPSQEKLVPVPGTEASERDRAVATFDLIAAGDHAAAAAAEPQLHAARSADPADALLLTDLGWLAQQKNERREAAELYSEALRQDPASLPANTNYGVLLAQGGQLQDAARLWNRVYRENPGISELGFNLGTIECALGNRPAAERILHRLLTFQPDDPNATKLLTDIESERKSCGSAH